MKRLIAFVNSGSYHQHASRLYDRVTNPGPSHGTFPLDGSRYGGICSIDVRIYNVNPVFVGERRIRSFLVSLGVSISRLAEGPGAHLPTQ